MKRLILSAGLVLALPAPAAAPSLRLGTLAPSEIPDGAGCDYSLAAGHQDREGPTVFAIPADLNGIALIRVDGGLHKLTERQDKRRQDGHWNVELWSDGRVEVELRYRVTEVGEAGVAHEGTLLLRVGTVKRAFRIRGGCGC